MSGVPDHVAALRALAILGAELAKMELHGGNGQVFTVADVCSQLLAGAESMIVHHERLWYGELMRSEVARIVPPEGS